MSNIQKTLDALQPYVIGIRYVEGVPVIDAVFKEGWTVQQEQYITAMKGEQTLNYFMIYSDAPNIGLDELLGFVSRTIKANQEREKKHELLRAKVEELKVLFKQNSLDKLTRLKFMFTEEDLVPKLNDFDLNIDDEPKIVQPPIVHEEKDVIIVTDPDRFAEEYFGSEDSSTSFHQPQTMQYVDEDGNPIQFTEEEMEILEEERRGEVNRRYLETKKKGRAAKIELPPK